MHSYDSFFISYKICRPKKFAALGPGLTGLGVNTALVKEIDPHDFFSLIFITIKFMYIVL